MEAVPGLVSASPEPKVKVVPLRRSTRFVKPPDRLASHAVDNTGADLGLLAGGVSVSRSHMSFYLRTGGRGGRLLT